MMARPVHREDRWAYLGTQYLAERLKNERVAGILYGSSMRDDGTNLALFSGDYLIEKSLALFEATKIHVSINQLSPVRGKRI